VSADQLEGGGIADDPAVVGTDVSAQRSIGNVDVPLRQNQAAARWFSSRSALGTTFLALAVRGRCHRPWRLRMTTGLPAMSAPVLMSRVRRR